MGEEDKELKTLYAKLGRGILIYFWDQLVMSDNPINYIGDFNKQILQLTKGLTIDKSIKLLNNFNVTTYKDEIDLLSAVEMKKMLIEVISYTEAFQSAVGNRSLGADSRLKVTGLFEKYIIAANARLLENHSDFYLQILINEFDIKSNASPLGRDKFRAIEKEEFELLFGPNKTFDKEYLENRLFMTSDEIIVLRDLRIPFNDGQYSKLLSVINADRIQALGKLLAIKDYLKFLSGKNSIVTISPDTSLSYDIQPNYPNLTLRPEFHINIEKAHKELRGEFITSNYIIFRGVLVKGEFVEKVQLCGHTTVAEIKLLIKEIQGCLNVSSKWDVSNTLFLRDEIISMTRNSFNSAKIKNIPPDRAKQIKKIASIIKDYRDV